MQKKEKRKEGIFAGDSRPFVIERRKNFTPWSMQNYHYHDKIEFYYLFSGSRYYFIKDKSYYIKEGDLVTVAPYDIHSTTTADKGFFDRVLISLDKSYLSGADSGVFGDVFAFVERGSRVVELSLKERAEVELLLEGMLKEQQFPTPDSDAYIKSALLRLVLLLNRKNEKVEKESPEMSERTLLVSRVSAAVNSRFSEKLSLTSLAEEFFVSPSYLSRSFARATGMTLVEYVNAVRIKEAERLLLSTTRSVADIAEAVGYSSTTHFGRVFRRHKHLTPLDFRMKKYD